MVGSLAFSFRPPRGALVVADRLRFRACYGRFTLARMTEFHYMGFYLLSRLGARLSYPHVFSENVFCPVVIMGDFLLSGRIVGESRTVGDPVFV